MKCPICHNMISFDDIQEDSDSLKAHMLWNHPTESEESRALVELYLNVQAMIGKFATQQYIEASMIGTDLSTLALRVKKYADIKLGE